MDVKFTMKNRCLIAKPVGEMDHHTCERIRMRIDREYDEQGALHIIMDLKGIDFMDSSGIGLIMGRYRKAAMMGGKVILVHVSDKLDRVFAMAGLYKILKKATDIKEAAAALTGAEGGRS